METPKILDNSIDKFQLKTTLRNLFVSGKYSQISIATGYWDLPGMLELLPAFETFLGTNMLTEIRFLIGEEPKVRINQLDMSFPERYLKEDLKDLPFKPEYQSAAKFLSQHLDTGRIKVKLYKRGFLHAKCYIVGSETENAIGIIGSSNFTRSGLLGNTELNDVEHDHRIVNYIPKGDTQDPSHRSWFEKLWNDEMNVDWNRQFNLEILGLSKFGNLTYSPYEMYIRILYEIYGEDIEIEEKLKSDPRFESRVNLTLFQEESFRKVMSKLNNEKIGMCLVSDSVGLGKSFIARKVIEEFGYYMRKNVVVVCPASLRDDWQTHLGLVDNIYSGDREKQMQAIEELERENDLAFDEAFENDLRDFMRKASDKEKEDIKNLNFNKYCGIPALKDDDKLLAFNIGKGEFEFIRTDGNKAAKESNQLKALKQIRSFDKERKVEKLTFDKKQALEDKALEIFESEKAYQTTIEGVDLESFMGVRQTGGASSLARCKEELLKLLQDNADCYSADNINRIKTLLASRNLALDNRIRNYLKRYDNQISMDLLDTLAFLSANLIKDETPQKPPEPELWFGWHALNTDKA